jgi:hypothetical protein
MNKRYAHHVWRYLRRIHPWYFLALASIFGVLSLISLRHNNEHMVVLRDNVYAADKNGTDTEGALRQLRQYVYAHMNTSLASGPNAVHPPIQLKYTYERLQQAQTSVLGQGNSTLYAQAQAYCESQSDIGAQVISCIQTYATSHGVDLAPIPAALYEFDFTSAKWSFDLAGWSIIVTVFSVLLLLVTSFYRWWNKKYVL